MPRGVKNKTKYTCSYCGKEFSKSKNMKKPHNHYFCNNDCWTAYCNSKYDSSTCKQCGKEFTYYKRNDPADGKGIFCSRECAFEYKSNISRHKKYSLKIRRCVACDKIFFLKGHKAKYCSDKCRLVAAKNAPTYNNQDARRERFIPKEKECKNCGSLFMTTFKGNKSFCSDNCRVRYLKERKQQRKHHRLDGIIIDNDITLTKLSKRDGGVCQLCGQPVDWNDYKTDDAGSWIAGARYPSIDHIYPICNGGKHSWENVQLAHFLCNSLKGAGAG